MSYLEGWESATKRLDARCGRGWQPGPGGKCVRSTKKAEDLDHGFKAEDLFGEGATHAELNEAAGEFGNKVALGGGLLAGGLLAAGAASAIKERREEKQAKEKWRKARDERKAKEAEVRKRRSQSNSKA